MIGLYLKAEDDPSREDLLRQLAVALGSPPPSSEVVVITPSATNMSLLAPRRADAGRAPMSWLCSWPQESFQAMAMSPSLRQLRSSWSAVLLEAANRALVADGMLLVGVQPGGEAKGLWTKAWLETTLGAKATSQESGLLTFRRGGGRERASVLRWFLEDAGRLVLDTLQSTLRPEERIENVLIGATASPRIVRQSWDPASFEGFKVDATDAGSAVHAFNYAIGGVAYKAPILQHIMATLMPSRRDISLLDVGGGMGVVSAEMLPENDHIVEATNCDPYLPHLALSQRLSHRFAERLAGRFRVGHVTAEAMEYDRQHDVISFLGSLLYVPRNRTQETLDRAWAHLRPGGLLVVHENIRNERYSRDLGHMFTVDEINGYLGAYGKPTCWLSTATATIEPSAVGERSVFRVFQKPR